MDSRPDEQLVTAHLGGDREALAGIYDRYADALYDTAAAMLRDRDEAADAMQEVFLIAAERLGQLRDPSRLKPWLFAILRNEVYRRSKRRRRDRPTDFTAPGVAEMAAPADPGGEGATVSYAELAESVRTAAAGLDARDQLVLEFSVRQGLTGGDLAAALGVTADQSYVLVHRMRDRVERSLGALAVARAGRKDCPELQRILGAWDGTFDVLVRKRVARHVDSCDTCGETKRRYAAVPLLAAAPALAAPPGLRQLVLGDVEIVTRVADELPYDFTADDGFPTRVRRARRGAGLLAAAAVATVVVLGGAAAVLGSGGGGGDTLLATGSSVADDAAITPQTSEEASGPAVSTTVPTTTSTPTIAPTTAAPTTSAPAVVVTTAVPTTVPVTTVPPPTVPPTVPPTLPPTTVPPPPPPPPSDPGFLQLSSSVVDLGAEASSATMTLRNTGGSPVEWALDGEAAPFTWTSDTQSLAPGASSTVEFVLDRSGIAEGTLSRVVAITTDGGGGGPVEVRARIERPPLVRIENAPRRLSCPWSVPPFVTATVGDESALSSVVLDWSGPGDPGSTPMRQGTGGWSGRLDVDAIDGTWTYVVVATDERGNVGVDAGELTVTGC